MVTKATHAAECERFEQIPNIGRAMAADFRQLGFVHPRELAGQDPLSLYQRMVRLSGQRQDPCVLDTYMAAVDFMQGGPVRACWEYTLERKRRFPDL